jgi:hypothetical protein
MTDIRKSFIGIIIIFDEAFKYGGFAKCWDYFGPYAEPICIEFCNFCASRILKLFGMLNDAKKVGELFISKTCFICFACDLEALLLFMLKYSFRLLQIGISCYKSCNATDITVHNPKLISFIL